MNLWMPVPKNIPGMLQVKYETIKYWYRPNHNLNKYCVTKIFDHRKGKYLHKSEQVSISCEKLMPVFPFVFRQKHERGCKETLKKGDVVLYSTIHSYECEDKLDIFT